MATARPYASGYFALDLDGTNCGMIKSIEGLNTKAEVIRLANSGGYRQNAQLGNISPEDCKLQMAGIMGGPLLDWIQAALDMNHVYKQGAVIGYDFNLKSASITQFTDALLTKVTWPKCDGAAKDPAYMGIEFAAQTVKKLKGDGANVQKDLNAKQKTLRTDSFRVVVDKIGPDPCKRINTFESPSVAMKISRDQCGDARWYELVPGSLATMPDLKFTVAEVDCEAFYAWHEDFVVNGNCSAEAETSIELTYLDQSLKNELMTVTFSQVGIFNLSAGKREDMADGIQRCTIEAYCEDVKWKVNA
jgi:hypothetical protein